MHKNHNLLSVYSHLMMTITLKIHLKRLVKTESITSLYNPNMNWLWFMQRNKQQVD